MNNKQLAEHRADLLWARYKKNGDHITCAEVTEITGKRVANVYHAFQVQGVVAPTVYDTQAAIRQRKICDLQDSAKTLGRDWLSVSEAAEATGVALKNIHAMVRSLQNEEIPEIRNSASQKITVSTSPAPRHSPKKNSLRQNLEAGPPTVGGLEYYKKLPGSEPGQVRYLLK